MILECGSARMVEGGGGGGKCCGLLILGVELFNRLRRKTLVILFYIVDSFMRLGLSSKLIRI